jgi:type IV fimbrial biogenesis protein FimT
MDVTRLSAFMLMVMICNDTFYCLNNVDRRQPRQAHGFSLVELMVVIAIVAILAGVAAPSFRSMLQNNRVSAAASALQVTLSLARSEAVKRGGDARVTVAANQTAGHWENGWTVFFDATGTANGGVAPTADSTATPPLVTRIEVVSARSDVSFGQTGSLNYFSYNGQGRMVDVNGGPANRSFWFYAGDSDKYCLIISVTGRVRMSRTGGGSACATDS